MANNIPEITLKQMKFMKSKKSREQLAINGIMIDIQPYMFPPKSPYSYSTKILLDSMNLGRQRVLEIGTGCGILSVAAAKQGAYVDGVDILPECVQFSLDNAIRNGVFQKTRFYYSNMFSNVEKSYDSIICNLPILEGELPEQDLRWYSLFDPNFNFHKELFKEGKKIAPRIIMAHADIAGKEEFNKLEQMAQKYNWQATVNLEKEYAGQIWRSYTFNQEGNSQR
jgi:methylase of polypeptide subunit release factors